MQSRRRGGVFKSLHILCYLNVTHNVMRRIIRCLSILVSTFVGLLALYVAYGLVEMSRDDEMLWLVLNRKAVLIEDGKRIDGWLHREWKGPILIMTRESGPAGRESYLIFPRGRHVPVVEDCDGWTAMHLPILPFPLIVSDVLTCPGWRLPEHPALLGKAALSSHSVEFVDERGRSLEARWE